MDQQPLCATDQKQRSAEIIGNNEVLIGKILLHMPAKFIVRFLFVSKKWHSIIKSPQFKQKHVTLHPPSLSGLFLTPKANQTKQDQIEFASLQQQQEQQDPEQIISAIHTKHLTFLNSLDFQILTSCNGLLFCGSLGTGKYYICNPTTFQFKVLPDSLELGLNFSYDPKNSQSFALTLAFDPKVSPHYKVLFLKPDAHVHIRKVAIYSSDTGLWTLSGADPEMFGDEGLNFRHGVFHKGKIHWVLTFAYSILTGDIHHLYYDIGKECFKELQCPPPSNITCEYLLGESKGHLYNVISVKSSHMFDDYYFVVYDFDEDSESWGFVMKVDLYYIASRFPSINQDYNAWYVLSVLCGENEKDVQVVLSTPGEIVVYNHRKTTIESMHMFMGDDQSKTYQAHGYLETLSVL